MQGELLMPHMKRLEAPGALVHIMARGIDGQIIFEEGADRDFFLARMNSSLIKCGCKCFAWCLMPNHYHFLIRAGEFPLSKLLRPVNGIYARRFNKKHNRTGYLFQDRFKSVLCQDMAYAEELIRYINLNPIRAGLVKSINGLLRYEWCGHAYLLGKAKAPGDAFLNREETLRRFGANPQAAVQKYLEFLADGIEPRRLKDAGRLGQAEAFELSGSKKGWPAVIGDPEFARNAMNRHAIALHRKHRQADYPAVLDKLALETCRKFKLSIDELQRKGRQNKRTQARMYFCSRAHYKELVPYGKIAEFLKITIPPVMRLADKERSASR
ncbi:MAG: hypothetical protein GF398_18905 [Chitinivibrionales bacterium]|nr:hypothetical protein [Chitinivibrionales bacterium]